MIDEETGENFDYTSSIDSDTYNKVKLTYDNEETGKREVYIAQDGSHINEWGILQYFDTLSKGENGQAKADALLQLYNTFEQGVFTYSDICAVEFFVITNDERTEHTITGKANVGGALSGAAAYFITNDSKETITANGSASHGGGIVNAVSVTITNDFNEQFNIDGTNSLGSGAVVTEIIGINDEE